MLVFGYGSLININSLRSTVPGATNIMPAVIKGYRRAFIVNATAGFKDSETDMAGIPFCALDVIKTDKEDDVVNGIVFSLDEQDFKQLMRREFEYRQIKTEAFSFLDQVISFGKVSVFVATNSSGVFESDSKAQKRYVEICLQGAKEQGKDFYEYFIRTTYLKDQRLADLIRATEKA